jgi:hypothetical protein
MAEISRREWRVYLQKLCPNFLWDIFGQTSHGTPQDLVLP